MLVSKGSLKSPADVSSQKEQDGISFTWNTDDQDYQNRFDNLMLVVYFPAQKQALCWLNIEQRQKGSGFVPLSNEQLGMEAHCYLSFMAVDLCKLSDSVYLGISAGQ